ncbi:MAG: alpha-hydroxy-acid oxidizing protein, partial [Ginsengibacter sp.]
MVVFVLKVALHRFLVEKYKGKIKIMRDSGLRSNSDIARTLASGSEFAFLGRTFMYGAEALGDEGGNHTITILKRQLQQVMQQICCERLKDLPEVFYLIDPEVYSDGSDYSVTFTHKILLRLFRDWKLVK